MSHSNTQRLTDYWQSRRSAGLAPLRADVDPTDFADLLPQVFILGRLGAGRYRFRLSGGLVEALHGEHSLRDADFISLWREGDRIGLQTAMEAALRRGAALVVDAQGEAVNGQRADLEILLAPMSTSAGEVTRFLGLVQPVTSLWPLRDQPVGPLGVRLVRLAVEDEGAARTLPRLKLAAMNGRRLA
ncbi:MAG TPA: PAS domain-containing protein [Caulobacteraceae bacterium]|nr:PAS domain-containing protein [Caulobacteraceae bacterium]